MAFTRPRAAQIDFDATNISDSLIRINSAETGDNTNDLGIVFERGNHTNAALVWDESADAFRFISTTHTGAGSTTDINISGHHNLHVGTLAYGSLNDGTTTLTATVAELNYVDGVTSNIQTQIDNISSSFTLAADSGSSDTFTTGETLTIAGGTGIDTTVSDNNISVSIDSTVATLTGTQTLTNKTLDVPVVTGNLTVDTNTLFVDAANNRVGIGTTSPAYQVEIENTGANALLVLDRTDGAACFIEGQATRSAFGSVGATPLALAYNSAAVVTIGASGAITVNPDGANPYTFPTTDGSANQFLQTDGSGAVTFSNTLTSPSVNTEAKMLAQAELEFYDSDSSNYVSFRGPATVTTNITWTLPNTDGTEGQVLSTNGAGTLAWADAGSGGGGSGSSYPNSTFSTVPGTDGNFDMSYNVAQTSQEIPFESGGTDAFGVNLGSVFSCMDPIGTTESIDYADGEAYVGA